MNFKNEDPDITYSIALRKGKFYTKWEVNLTKVKFLYENFIDQKMRTEGVTDRRLRHNSPCMGRKRLLCLNYPLLLKTIKM